MPLPKPNDGESQGDFMDRCMGNETMVAEYPDEEQRAAVCHKQWEGKGAGEPETRAVPEKLATYIAKIDDVDREKQTMVVKISTDKTDRDNEVIVPKGISLKPFRANPVVLWAHKYDEPPIAKALWTKMNDQGEMLSKPQFMQRSPSNILANFSADVYELYLNDYLNAWSVGLAMVKGQSPSAPTDEELKERPDWAGVDYVWRKTELLEFSAVPIPANRDALTIARSKGLHVPDEMLAMLPPPEPTTVEDWDYQPPLKTEHESQFVDASRIQSWTLKRVTRTAGDKSYIAIRGEAEANGEPLIHAFRYPLADWTTEEALDHSRQHKAVTFTPAPAAREVLKVLDVMVEAPPIPVAILDTAPRVEPIEVKIVDADVRPSAPPSIAVIGSADAVRARMEEARTTAAPSVTVIDTAEEVRKRAEQRRRGLVFLD